MKIILCTAGASDTTNALRFATLLALAGRCPITLLGIAETADRRVALAAALERDRSSVSDEGVACEVELCDGETTRAVVGFADRLGPHDLVVVGAQRKAGSGRYWRSARVYKLIRMLRGPVLVVLGRRENLGRLLVCTGGLGFINPALDVTAELAVAAGAEVTLLHIATGSQESGAGIEHVLGSETELGRGLRAEEARLRAAGARVQVRVRQGGVLQELAEEIRQHDYDMVVTGTTVARNALRRHLMGDLTREIVNRVGCPVLVVPSQPPGAPTPPVTPRRTWRFLARQ